MFVTRFRILESSGRVVSLLLLIVVVLFILSGCKSGGGSSSGSGGDKNKEEATPPVAVIQSITPNPANHGQSISFSASGTSSDDTEIHYQWTSDISGLLSDQANFSKSDLPVGMHTITLVATDKRGLKSNPSSVGLEIKKVSKPPVANIKSITPNPANQGQTVAFSGSGSAPDGTVVAYEWASDISGPLSNKANFSSTGLVPGVHWITLRVTDDNGVTSDTVTKSLEIIERIVEYEDIYVALVYSWEHIRVKLVRPLERMGARDLGTHFEYDRGDKIFRVHFLRDRESYEQALRTEGAHILISGHSVYGIGQIFPDNRENETRDQTITNFWYMDDDRLINTSSEFMNVNVWGLIHKEALPNWWPVFKDGSSAVAAYNFNDPQGEPPFNYYHTYQIPGDPTHYKTESARNGALERFPDSKASPWYSAVGNTPNPNNHQHEKYYIINKSPKDVKIDGVTYPPYHYKSNTIIFRRNADVPQEEFRFKRMLIDTCYSGTYYLGTFNRGTVFYALDLASGRGVVIYLQAYLNGWSDEQIWEAMQEFDPVYDYYDFTKKPSEQQSAREAAEESRGQVG
jgi:hypothetical protein